MNFNELGAQLPSRRMVQFVAEQLLQHIRLAAVGSLVGSVVGSVARSVVESVVGSALYFTVQLYAQPTKYERVHAVAQSQHLISTPPSLRLPPLRLGAAALCSAETTHKHHLWRYIAAVATMAVLIGCGGLLQKRTHTTHPGLESNTQKGPDAFQKTQLEVCDCSIHIGCQIREKRARTNAGKTQRGANST